MLLALTLSLALPLQEPSPPPADDDSSWHWWWHYNKEPYLALRGRTQEMVTFTGSQDFFLGIGIEDQPEPEVGLSRYARYHLIAPLMLEVIEEEVGTNALVAPAVFALAKIGQNPDPYADEPSYAQLFLDLLEISTTSLRQTLILSLGLLGEEDAIPPLIELALNTRAGKRLLRADDVPIPERAFAVYALGLVGMESEDPDVRRHILRTLVEILDGPELATRDVKVACVQAYSLLPLPVMPLVADLDAESGRRLSSYRPDPTPSRRHQIRYLLAYQDDLRRTHPLVRAHIPTALARLFQGASPQLKEEIAEPLMDLIGRHSKAWNQVQQSAVLALGEIGDSDADPIDRAIRKTLLRVAYDGERQSRFFCILALARLASRPGQSGETLIERLDAVDDVLRFYSTTLRRGESRAKPWVGFSMGLMAWHLAEAGMPFDERSTDKLRDLLEDVVTPIDAGAYGMGIGLLRDTPSLEVLEEKLEFFNIEAARGFMALAMGLIGETRVKEALYAVLDETLFRPEQFGQVAIALTLLRDRDLVPDLERRFREESGSQISEATLINTLANVGDERAVYLLVEIARDSDRYTDGTRANALTALGAIGDRRDLLWRHHYSSNANYLSNPVTFRGGGILDRF